MFPQICQSFAVRRRTFLEEKRWKTIPWEKVPKTALDSLIDILADMPGIVNDMAASEHPISPATKASFHATVRRLRTDLQAWRWQWHRLHPRAARAVPSHLDLDAIDTPVFREQLATMIRFDTTQQALEMLTYNAGLIYLMQLEDLLDMRVGGGGDDSDGDHAHIPHQPHNSTRLTPADEAYLRDVNARHPAEQPLLLPGEARLVCQPALEAFRLIPSLYRNLITTKDRIMVILAPLGIVYCSTRRHAELNRCMQSILNDIPFFGGGPPRELSVYELALGKEWHSAEPEPIPAGATPDPEASDVLVI